MRVGSVDKQFAGKTSDQALICDFRADFPILYSKGRTLVTNQANSRAENLRKCDRFFNITVQPGGAGTKCARRNNCAGYRNTAVSRRVEQGDFRYQ